MLTLRSYQHDAVVAAWAWLAAHAGNPVVSMPTGSGKSVVIAKLCEDAVNRWGGKIICLAHRKELLQQNAEKIQTLLPNMKIGLFSAGLKARDRDDDIVVAGIQSAYKRAYDFGERNLVLIDEVHLVPHDGEGMYRRFLSDLRSANPKFRMIGLTATPFRLDCGPLCRPDGLFQKVCYSAPVREMIEAGYLTNLVSKPAVETVDTSGLHIRGGEFVEHEVITAFDKQPITEASCREIVANTADRKSILIFCAGVSHAAHVKREIEGLTGEPCGMVTGESMALERDATLGAFRRRQLRWLVNVDVLTHGFDAPCIDCIAILRATMSPGLYAQIVGRGFRVFPEKADCLVLDFGGNIRRHGPVDAIDFGRPKGHNGHAGEAPTKVCPNCKQDVFLSARECECGFVFPEEKPPHDERADTQSAILSVPEEWIVEEMVYSRHEKKNRNEGAPPTMEVNYTCIPCEGTGGNLERKNISEWVCLEHTGYARMKAVRWWKTHSIAPVPDSVDEAVDLCKRGAVASAHHITTRKDGRWYRVLGYGLDEKPKTWSAESLEADPWEEEVPF